MLSFIFGMHFARVCSRSHRLVMFFPHRFFVLCVSHAHLVFNSCCPKEKVERDSNFKHDNV